MTDQPTFEIYEFDISITLRKKTDRYSSTNLVKFSTEQEKPLLNDYQARVELSQMVRDALQTSDEIVESRIEFDNHVKALTRGGETVDA